MKQIGRAALRLESLGLAAELGELDSERPRTRGDCAGGPRPCPWVSCRHNLYLDINPETGTIKFTHGSAEPDEVSASCSLDVADEGPHTLEQVGEHLNVTRERMRQIEGKALIRMRQARAIRDAGGA